jgi:hypothetical protein
MFWSFKLSSVLHILACFGFKTVWDTLWKIGQFFQIFWSPCRQTAAPPINFAKLYVVCCTFYSKLEYLSLRDMYALVYNLLCMNLCRKNIGNADNQPFKKSKIVHFLVPSNIHVIHNATFLLFCCVSLCWESWRHSMRSNSVILCLCF